MFSGEINNFQKNIIQEISKECCIIDIFVSDGLISYLVKLLSLNPEWGMSDEKSLTRDEIALFVKKCVSMLSDEQSPSLIIIKIQFYCTVRYLEKNEIVCKNREIFYERITPLEKEIVDMHPVNEEEKQRLFLKLVVYITLRSGLGNPLREPVQQEAHEALHSIFPLKELDHFIYEPKKQKEKQLTEMTHLVMGIRLFNKDCKKGGEGIDDLPSILTEKIDSSISSFKTMLKTIMNRVNTLTTAIDSSFIVDEDIDPKDDDNIKLDIANNISQEFLDQVKDLLALSRQYEVYIRKLLTDMEKSKKRSVKMFDKLRKLLVDLHEVVQLRTAIPTVQVFPLFLDIAEVWQEIQDENIFVNQLNEIAMHLIELTENLNFDDSRILQMTKNNEILTDAQRLVATTGLSIYGMKTLPECTVIHPSTFADFDSIQLQFLGFCIWSFVAANGALIPGNPNIGVCKWKDLYYAFSSVEAAAKFMKNPDKYINQALESVRIKPHLIKLLHLMPQIAAVSTVEKLYVKPPFLTVKNNVEVQTELHPIPTKIDPTYNWNVWDLKKKAVQLADIVQRKTTSQQTGNSHFRSSIRTQTYKKKSKEMETQTDNSSNVPKPQTFVFGLRGRKDDKQHVITLTRSVNE